VRTPTPENIEIILERLATRRLHRKSPEESGKISRCTADITLLSLVMVRFSPEPVF
jgi:hypothetical protein